MDTGVFRRQTLIQSFVSLKAESTFLCKITRGGMFCVQLSHATQLRITHKSDFPYTSMFTLSVDSVCRVHTFCIFFFFLCF